MAEMLWMLVGAGVAVYLLRRRRKGRRISFLGRALPRILDTSSGQGGLHLDRKEKRVASRR